jgi:hypothetical protein
MSALAKLFEEKTQENQPRESWLKSRQLVSHILEQDQKCRRIGIQDGLFFLKDLVYTDWDFCLPTLVLSGGNSDYRMSKKHRSTNNTSLSSEHNRVQTMSDFKTNFYSQYPFMRHFPWNKYVDQLVIAGGSIASALVGKVEPETKEEKVKFWKTAKRDIDFFIYNVRDAEGGDILLESLHKDLLNIYVFSETEKHKRQILKILKEMMRCLKKALSENKEEKHTKIPSGFVSAELVHRLRLQEIWEKKDLEQLIQVFQYTLDPKGQTLFFDDLKTTEFLNQITKPPIKSFRVQFRQWLDEISTFAVTRNCDIRGHLKSLNELIEASAIPISISQYRNKNVLSYNFPEGNRVQVVFRLYSSVSEIIHGFDLGSSAVAFDGEQVYFTSLSKFCYERRINLLDPTRRSLTFEKRLKKYAEHPFDFRIVMPHLDIAQVKTAYHKYGKEEILDLPSFPIAYSGVSSNAIYVSEFLEVENDEQQTKHDDDERDYDHGMLDSEDCKYSLLHRNLYIFLKSGPESLIYISSSLTNKILDCQPYLTSASVLGQYQHFQKHMFINNKKVDLKVLRDFFPLYATSELVELLIKNMENDKSKEIIKKICDAQAQHTIDEYQKWLSNPGNNKIPWITENPTTQGVLTASLHFLPTTNQEFYGKYCLV